MQQPQKQANQQETQHQNHKKDQISQAAKEKVGVAKSYIERKYSRRKEEEIAQRENWDQLQRIMDTLNIPEIEQEQIKKEIIHKDAEQMRQKQYKLTNFDDARKYIVFTTSNALGQKNITITYTYGVTACVSFILCILFLILWLRHNQHLKQN